MNFQRLPFLRFFKIWKAKFFFFRTTIVPLKNISVRNNKKPLLSKIYNVFLLNKTTMKALSAKKFLFFSEDEWSESKSQIIILFFFQE